MDLHLADKVFVVTAASVGLGRATADQLVAEGARVVLVARDPERLASAVAALGPERAASLAADLSDPDAAGAACALALERFDASTGRSSWAVRRPARCWTTPTPSGGPPSTRSSWPRSAWRGRSSRRHPGP